MDTPKTLIEAIRYFADFENCRQFMMELRWPDGEVTCPHCGSDHVKYLSKVRVWKCYAKHPRPTFSLKTGTIFEDSALALDKWLVAVWLIVNCKNGVSSYELARHLGVMQKSAWFMNHRIRLALQNKSFDKFGGEVEVDETFIGGKARNMHKDRKARVLKGRKSGWAGKAAVMGLLDRHGQDGHSVVRTEVIDTNRRREILPHIRKHVKLDGQTTVYTDALKSYTPKTPRDWRPTDESYIHKVIDHAECYAKGNVHTNGMENFWSLLKRGLKGTYVSVEPFHLFRYLDEQAFRFNNRRTMDDFDRFKLAATQVVGRRLTYAEVSGKANSSESIH